MEKQYQSPEAELIDFRAQEKLAVIEDDVKDPEAGVGSRDFFD